MLNVVNNELGGGAGYIGWVSSEVRSQEQHSNPKL
jgi:hypothetical protein